LDRRYFLASLPFLFTACVTRDTSQRYREGDNSGQVTELTFDDEKKMTDQVLPQMQKDYPPLNHDGTQRYIQDLGLRLTKANQLEGNPYHYSFTAVDVDQINAFALPAGTVFVTAPLIAMCDSEAELAGVIGHEIGHIQARHTAERMERAKRAQTESWKYALGGGLTGALLGYGLGRLVCNPNDTKCLQEVTKRGAGLGVGGGLLVQKYGFMQNSQEDELEADRVGFRVSYKAGFHRDHIGGFYNKLYRMEQEMRSKQGRSGKIALLSALQDALSTHPPSPERVHQMQQMTQDTPLRSNSVISSSEFTSLKKQVLEHYSKKKSG
jgi:predicted Zn-dependent protease